MAEFRMPSLGADMDAGTLVEWRVAPGDRVERGQIIAVVETQKAAVEVEVFTNGVVDQLLVQPGEKVPVGTVLATLREASESIDPAGAITPAPAPRRPRVSPAARRRARQLGIDLASLRGTGPHGSVVLRDVEAGTGEGEPAPAAPAPTAPPAPAPSDRASSIRRAIAVAMARSKREIPHYYLGHSIELGPARAHLATLNSERPIERRLLLGVLYLKATALALRAVPELNGHYVDDQFAASEAVHLGVAISLRGGGVIAPALRDADQKSLDQLMTELRDLTGRTRAGRLRSSEMGTATATVTSLGERAPEEVYGVIFPPQVAIIGFGGVIERPWVAGDGIAIRPTVRVTLSADHRVSDGHLGARLLATIDRLLADPEAL